MKTAICQNDYHNKIKDIITKKYLYSLGYRLILKNKVIHEVYFAKGFEPKCCYYLKRFLKE